MKHYIPRSTYFCGLDTENSLTIVSKMDKILDKLHLGSKDEGAPPTEPTKEELSELRERYVKAGQEQVFAFYDELAAAEKAGLYEHLASFNPDHINEITQKALSPAKDDSSKEETKLEPLPESATASILDSKPEDIESWYNSGLDLVVAGQVAVVLMAGGQGTRLGSSAPKGCFNIGLPSQKSLFQIQAERIWKIQQLAEKKSGKKDIVIPWYIMTSGPTRKPTEQFFEEHKYFGLGEDDVVIFEQGVLPCISNEGKILLESKSKVCTAGQKSLYQILTKIKGSSSSRWQRWHISSPSHLECPYGHEEAWHSAYSRLLCGQLPRQSCGPCVFGVCGV